MVARKINREHTQRRKNPAAKARRIARLTASERYARSIIKEIEKRQHFLNTLSARGIAIPDEDNRRAVLAYFKLRIKRKKVGCNKAFIIKLACSFTESACDLKPSKSRPMPTCPKARARWLDRKSAEREAHTDILQQSILARKLYEELTGEPLPKRVLPSEAVQVKPRMVG